MSDLREINQKLRDKAKSTVQAELQELVDRALVVFERAPEEKRLPVAEGVIQKLKNPEEPLKFEQITGYRDLVEAETEALFLRILAALD